MLGKQLRGLDPAGRFTGGVFFVFFSRLAHASSHAQVRISSCFHFARFHSEKNRDWPKIFMRLAAPRHWLASHSPSVVMEALWSVEASGVRDARMEPSPLGIARTKALKGWNQNGSPLGDTR